MKKYIVAFGLNLPKDKAARKRRANEALAEISKLKGFVGVYFSIGNFVAVFESKEDAYKGILFMNNYKYTDCLDSAPLITIESEVTNG